MHNERELLIRIANGDQQAFAGLFNAYRDKVYEIALTFTHSNDMAEEVVQDVFMGLWIKRSNALHIQHFENYLFIVVRNTIYRNLKMLSLRQKKAADFITRQQDFIAPDPLELLLDKDYRRVLSAAVGHLPFQQRQVYQLIKEQGLSREETALQLDLQPETVKKHLSLAMRSIRAFCLHHLDILVWLAVYLRFFL